jgi:hypothetical protein
VLVQSFLKCAENGGQVTVTLVDIFILMAGVAAIYIGCTKKTFYYGWIPPTAPLNRAPTRVSRLMFVGIGVVFVLIEVARLFLDNR